MRLGFTVVPKDLKCGDVSLNAMWARRHGTKFNGAPYIVQRAGEAVYSDAGKAQLKEQVAYYMQNAKTIKEGLKEAGYTVFGGVNAQAWWRKCFLLLWATAAALKLLIASQLPLFVDEAFYWQEGQHLAPAYSDLPGLTAWLIRLGVELGGQHVLAVRLPFLAIAALIPWFVVAKPFRRGTILETRALLAPKPPAAFTTALVLIV